MQPNEITPHLFRTEYSKIVAVLCRRFRLQQIEIAEDIASDTFLKASEYWAQHGLPDNPTAWLYTVARNKAKDYFKHLAVAKTMDGIVADEMQSEIDLEFDVETIKDSRLAMIFTVCDPVNSVESQVALALQILCGFSVEEIAKAFLTKTETVKKRLLRARANLRIGDFQIKSLNATEIATRLDVVLQTVYLLFNEGYFSTANDQLIRKELCSEAVHLALLLVEMPVTNTPKANALLALMCYQSSRLDARVNDKGEAILFEEQDKNLWDQLLIDRGNYYLTAATKGDDFSKYHLEAAIAYRHTTPTGERKWEHILQLYNRLILIEYSPLAALNRVFALAKVYGNEKAIQEAEKLRLTDSNYYYGLLGYLYSEADAKKAIAYYELAIGLTRSKAERHSLQQQIEKLAISGGS